MYIMNYFNILHVRRNKKIFEHVAGEVTENGIGLDISSSYHIDISR